MPAASGSFQSPLTPLSESCLPRRAIIATCFRHEPFQRATHPTPASSSPPGNGAKQETLRWLLEGVPVVPVTPAEAGVVGRPRRVGGDAPVNRPGEKAREWSEAGQMLVIASDGGLVIPALGDNWESRYTHRFAGPAADDRERARRLLEVMDPLRGEGRSASWVEAVAVADRGEVLASWDLTGSDGVHCRADAAGGGHVRVLGVFPVALSPLRQDIPRPDGRGEGARWTTIGPGCVSWCRGGLAGGDSGAA